MADSSDPFAHYLTELRAELRHDPLLARRLCEEVADHLAEIAANERSQGMSQHDAEDAAIRRFGAPGPLARQFERFSFPLKALLTCAALATAVIALWLCTVVFMILPTRDPAHVKMWSAITVAFFVYAALSLAFVVRGPRPALLPAGVVVLSLAAIGFGGYAVTSMLAAANNGGHFEGYLLVMGVVLAGHGLCALAYTTLTAMIARRVRAA
jgi:hypothetical protein